MANFDSGTDGRLRIGRRFRVITIIELSMLVVFAFLPLLLGAVWSADDSFFWIVFATKVLILSLFGLSFDLVWGFGGMLSFGQALFFGGSGYVVAVLARDLDVSSAFIVIAILISKDNIMQIIIVVVICIKNFNHFTRFII